MLRGCREYKQELIELARGTAVDSATRRALLAHVEECAGCSRFFEDQSALSGVFHRVAAQGIAEASQFEARVLAEFDRVHRRPWVAARWALAAGLAAALCLALIWNSRRTPVISPHVAGAPAGRAATLQVPQPVSTPAVVAVRHVAARHRKVRPRPNEDAPFLPMPYTAPMGPNESASVVQMDIPVSALIVAGFKVQVSDPATVVHADVLVGQDGRARAIRPISLSVTN